MKSALRWFTPSPSSTEGSKDHDPSSRSATAATLSQARSEEATSFPPRAPASVSTTNTNAARSDHTSPPSSESHPTSNSNSNSSSSNRNSNRHSNALSSPSPEASHSVSLTPQSPQPATPTDGDLDRNAAALLSSKGHPIPIGAALPAAASLSFGPPAIESTTGFGFDAQNPFGIPEDQLDSRATSPTRAIDINMTTGSAMDSTATRPRQDSFVSAGPKPISVNNANRDQMNRQRRESLAGSLMGGASWSGMSLGSFIRDE